ncbi:MAG TPA: metallophosphoesterase [Polyangiaceae bacterium]|nr:metallophosphoesterase [Polyangiaceae bacterium]
MSRALSIAVFLTIALSLLGLIHYYVWARLVRDLSLPAGAQRALTIAIVTLFVMVPSWIWFSRMGTWARPLVWLSFTWTGVLLLLLLTLAFSDAGRGLLALVLRLQGDGPLDPGRRTLLARISAVSVLLLTGGLSVVALRSGLARVAVRQIEVRLRRLPRELDGVTIVQLTDIHVGPTIRRDFIEQIVATTNALVPDLIAITGDLVDGSVEDLRDQVEPLTLLKARYGVYFVTGNHEYYSGAADWCAELERMGIRVLRNERVSIGEGEQSFDLCGIDDPTGHGMAEGHGPDLEKALLGRDSSRELVLLAHQPRALSQAVEHGVGLQLSGHTHGGQIWPWSFLVRLQQPVVSGLEKIKDTFIYVSNGTGYWGPPMRLAAPAEITRIKLCCA